MLGVPWIHNPTAFWFVLDFVADMRRGETSKISARQQVSFIGLSRSDLPSWMLRRLVASILGLPAKPKSRNGGEILELQKVERKLRNSFTFFPSASNAHAAADDVRA